MWKSKIFKKIVFLFLLFAVIILELRFISGFYKEEKTVSDEMDVDEFSYTMNLLDVIFEEIKCFPVEKEEGETKYPVTYSDSFGAERTYGGERRHEGCDLMADENVRGKYKICSMTSGIVENIGWLEQGGWRIGIRSDSGAYYYYAHLDSYEKAYEIGEHIEAGQILGRMGDSGYGKEPGTKGKFDVHLHLGIYVQDMDGNERAINPYWYLKQLEK